MARFICLLGVIIGLSCELMSQDYIYYRYDDSGNRKSRTIELQSIAQTVPQEKSTEGDDQENTFKDQLGKVEVKIYPNPTKGLLRVDLLNLDNETTATLILYDSQGKNLINISIAGPTNLLDLSNFPGGSYFLLIKADDLKTNWTIIKK